MAQRKDRRATGSTVDDIAGMGFEELVDVELGCDAEWKREQARGVGWTEWWCTPHQRDLRRAVLERALELTDDPVTRARMNRREAELKADGRRSYSDREWAERRVLNVRRPRPVVIDPDE